MMTTIEPRAQLTDGPDETFALGRWLGRMLAENRRGGDPVYLVLLCGELGAGKTLFAKGLAQGLGVEDIDDVVSPTFTLVNEYPLPDGRSFHHVDLYRIDDPDQCEGIGLREILTLDNGSVCAVEWAEKVAGTSWDLTNHPAWSRVTLEDLGDDRRRITVEPGKGFIPKIQARRI